MPKADTAEEHKPTGNNKAFNFTFNDNALVKSISGVCVSIPAIKSGDDKLVYKHPKDGNILNVNCYIDGSNMVHETEFAACSVGRINKKELFLK